MPAKRDEDLFQDTTMTFGEHLEELRFSLFEAVLGLAIGEAVVFYDASGKEVGRVAAPADKLIVLHDGQQQTLIATGAGH